MTTTLETPAALAPVKAGDVFSSSWGYDQTNVDWYVVTKVSPSGKTATFLKVAAATVADNGPATYKVADVSAAICKRCARRIRPLAKASGEKVWRHVENGQELCYVERIYGIELSDRWQEREFGRGATATPDTFDRRLRYQSDSVWANAHASYASMKRWDGAPKYETGIGWGH